MLKAGGSIWVSGTHHVIFSIGFALQSLEFKVINPVVWEKPDPPPNALRTAFTHPKAVAPCPRFRLPAGLLAPSPS